MGKDVQGDGLGVFRLAVSLGVGTDVNRSRNEGRDQYGGSGGRFSLCVLEATPLQCLASWNSLEEGRTTKLARQLRAPAFPTRGSGDATSFEE
jgi:hypothetical protein